MGTQVHVVDVLEKNRSQKGDFEYENSILNMKVTPKSPSIKWRPLLTLEHAQNTKEVLCKSQEKKKHIL